VYLHREDSQLVLESPLGYGKIIIYTPACMAMIQELSKPTTAETIDCHVKNVGLEGICAFMDLLLNINAIHVIQRDSITEEDEDPILAQWEFHDLLFHSRSREGRHDLHMGNTYRFLGKIDPLPALKSKMAGKKIPLFRPDMDSIKQHDSPFSKVLEERRSLREYCQPVMSIEQLGEFLFRVDRVRDVREVDFARGFYYQTSNRPYPGGGAAYELELYIVVNACEGIDQGLYYYDPFLHELCLLSEGNEYAGKIVEDACRASGLRSELEVLIVISARFQRVSWKYSGIAYSTILKDVGILMQNMYLVATAMNLAPCALGGGDSESFAHATGIDYLVESSVGEFILGRSQK